MVDLCSYSGLCAKTLYHNIGAKAYKINHMTESAAAPSDGESTLVGPLLDEWSELQSK